jgi:serine/threonine protein kinase
LTPGGKGRKGNSLARAPLRQSDPSRIGRYRLTARLGSGGMGVVYLGEPEHGRHRPGGGLVAIKVLRPELADDPEFRQRFSREVSTLMRVRGVCTVRVIDADTDADRPYLVTEYAEGLSLAEYVDAHGPLGPEMLFGLAAGLAEALTAIHAAGVVHRDLKPSNVLLTPAGPKVIDFGIAHALDAVAFTETGITMGSAGYMAPEQITDRAGTAADIFAWAVTIGFAAIGESPFGTGTSQGVMYRILHSVPDIEAVPESVRPQVAAALAKDPQERPTADELLAQLTGTAAPGRGDSPTQTVLLRTWRPAPDTRPYGPAGKRRAARRSARKRPDPKRSAREQDTGQPSGRRRAIRPALLGLAVLAVAVAATLGFTMAGQPNAGRVPVLRTTVAPAREHARTPIPRVTAVAATTPASRRTTAAPSPSPARGQTAKPAPSGSVAAATKLPVLSAGSYRGIRPSRVVFDASTGNVVTGLSWASWTATGADGSGQSHLSVCLPVCVQAGLVQTTIVLSDPVHGRFTQLTESKAGSSVAYTYQGSWPVSAS